MFLTSEIEDLWCERYDRAPQDYKDNAYFSVILLPLQKLSDKMSTFILKLVKKGKPQQDKKKWSNNFKL